MFIMSKWILSDNVQAEVASLRLSLPQNLETNIQESDDDYQLLKQFCKNNFENANICNPPAEPHLNTFSGGDYFEPLLDGIWKQCFVQSLSDDEEEGTDTNDGDSFQELNEEDGDKSVPELHDNSQQGSFLAELSQIFK